MVSQYPAQRASLLETSDCLKKLVVEAQVRRILPCWQLIASTMNEHTLSFTSLPALRGSRQCYAEHALTQVSYVSYAIAAVVNMGYCHMVAEGSYV
jgi:hypothetical protein